MPNSFELMYKKYNIRPATVANQHKKYLERWTKIENQGLHATYKNYRGEISYQKPLDLEAFTHEYFRVLEEKPEDRYVAGEKMADITRKYTEKQLHYFRYEVKDNLDKLPETYRNQILEIMRQNKTTKSDWSYTDFRKNSIAIMNLFWQAGGNIYLIDT